MVLRPSRIAAVCVSLLLAMPAVADAARPATPLETSQIERDLELRAGCTKITVATSGGARYARLDTLKAPGCIEWNGFQATTDAGMREGSWADWFAANSDGLPYCEDFEVPRSVGRDLGICNPKLRKTEVVVVDRTYVKPRLLGQGAHGYYKRVRWSKWSRTSAVGRGTFDYGDRYTRIVAPVKIKLSRPRVCESGIRVFTRQTITAARASDRKRIRFATSSRALVDCAHLDDQ